MQRQRRVRWAHRFSSMLRMSLDSLIIAGGPAGYAFSFPQLMFRFPAPLFALFKRSSFVLRVCSAKLGRPAAAITVDVIALQNNPVAHRRRRLAVVASSYATTATLSLQPYGGPNNLPIAKLVDLLTASGVGTPSPSLFAITAVTSTAAVSVCGNGVCESGERPERCVVHHDAILVTGSNGPSENNHPFVAHWHTTPPLPSKLKSAKKMC
jgi:hypothetical protein